MSHTSVGLTVTMLPKSTAKRSALKPRARLMSTTASAKPPERNTASAASPFNAPCARRRSMPTAPRIVTTSAPSTGDTPTSNPSATPARATWDRESAISDSRRGTRKTPMAGQITAVMARHANALCMKEYSRNSGIGGSVLVRHHTNRRAVERGQGRVAQEIAGTPVEDEAAVQARQLGHFLRDDADVVAHQDERDVALAIQVVQQGVEAGLRLRIHAARRLVQDQQLGLGDEGPGDEHALLLPDRERADTSRRMTLHADLAQHVVDPLLLRRADPSEQPEDGHEPRGDDLVHGRRKGGIEHRPLGHVAQSPPLAKRRRRVT